MSLVTCPECRAEVSTKADACPNCGAKRSSKNVGCGAIIVVLILLAIIGSIVSNNDSKNQSTTAQQPSLGVGSQVTLTVSSGDVVLCTTRSAYDEFFKLAIAKDYLGMGKMEAAGRLFRVPSGTKALVIDSGFEKREVRIVSGPHMGKSGWVTHTLVN